MPLTRAWSAGALLRHSTSAGGPATLGPDGTTVLVREDGWKEVKGVSISVVEPGPPEDLGRDQEEAEAHLH